MHQVGTFLAALFKDTKLSDSSLQQRRTLSPLTRSMSQQSTHILHACQNFSPSQLIRTVIGIFGGVPEPFEVFHCRPSVTEEELRLFLNPTRATKQPFQFLILEVNKLQYHLQEVKCLFVCLFVLFLKCQHEIQKASRLWLGSLQAISFVSNLYCCYMFAYFCIGAPDFVARPGEVFWLLKSTCLLV